MARLFAWGGVVGALLFVLSGAQALGETPPLPFTLTWTKGICRDCKIASNLSDVQFVAPDEAWAIGFMPPGGAGMGDYSVLHSRDGGKTWREIPEPWQHNEGPELSFASRRDGWLKDTDIGAAEGRLLLTHDGGVHWRRLPMRELFISGVQYLGDRIGFGLEEDIYAKQGYLIGTRDDGRHWTTTPLPKGFGPGPMHFMSGQRGLIVGCLGHRIMVIRTEDGGVHWTPHALDLPQPTSSKEGCTLEADSLDFLDAERGSLLAAKHSFGLDDRQAYAVAWTTADGGASWKSVFHAAGPEGGNVFFNSLHFFGDRVAFLPKNKLVGNATVGALLYTTDGGQNWDEIPLPQPLWGCKRYSDSLTCAAGEGAFWILRITPVGNP